jgi:transposase
MGYRELGRMEMVEVVRRWQLGESQRAIARASGVARETVKKYLGAAAQLGLAADGPQPTEDQVVRLVQLGRMVSAPRTWATPQADRLEPYREQITTWLQDERLQITRVQELLGQRGLHVTYSTLERFAWQLGFRPRRGRHGTTVRMAPTPPGEVAEMDFERLGLLLNPETGRRQLVWGSEHRPHVQPPQLLVAAGSADGGSHHRRPHAGVDFLSGLSQALVPR